MELTKEYFNGQIKKLATKDDLKMHTKELEDYTNQVAASILESIDAGFSASIVGLTHETSAWSMWRATSKRCERRST